MRLTGPQPRRPPVMQVIRCTIKQSAESEKLHVVEV